MVRVGGGWDTLQHYLDKHDPCRCKAGEFHTDSGLFWKHKPKTMDIDPMNNSFFLGHRSAQGSAFILGGKTARNGMGSGVCYDRYGNESHKINGKKSKQKKADIDKIGDAAATTANDPPAVATTATATVVAKEGVQSETIVTLTKPLTPRPLICDDAGNPKSRKSSKSKLTNPHPTNTMAVVAAVTANKKSPPCNNLPIATTNRSKPRSPAPSDSGIELSSSRSSSTLSLASKSCQSRIPTRSFSNLGFQSKIPTRGSSGSAFIKSGKAASTLALTSTANSKIPTHKPVGVAKAKVNSFREGQYPPTYGKLNKKVATSLTNLSSSVAKSSSPMASKHTNKCLTSCNPNHSLARSKTSALITSPKPVRSKSNLSTLKSRS